MANPNPTRLSPAELRRRLLAPPTEEKVIAPPVEESPLPPPLRTLSRRADAGRLGVAAPPSVDLDALAQEISPAKLTPLPDGRLDFSQLRNREESISPSETMFSMPQDVPSDDPGSLKLQNAELSRLIEEMRPVLEEASKQEERFQRKEQEYAAQLSEKNQQAEELLAKVKQLEEQLAAVPPPKPVRTHDELEEWGDELEQESAKLTQERHRLDEERRQLHDDEESLEKQMRDMEVSMARERAMMARQETELKRLSAEIQHELDMLQRGDGTLREQLSRFQRRHQEVLSRSAVGAPAAQPHETAAPPAAGTPPVPKDSGLFGRIFRGGK